MVIISKKYIKKMKHLKLFSNQTDYESFIGASMARPNVSFISNDNKIHYNNMIPLLPNLNTKGIDTDLYYNSDTNAWEFINKINEHLEQLYPNALFCLVYPNTVCYISFIYKSIFPEGKLYTNPTLVIVDSATDTVIAEEDISEYPLYKDYLSKLKLHGGQVNHWEGVVLDNTPILEFWLNYGKIRESVSGEKFPILGFAPYGLYTLD